MTVGLAVGVIGGAALLGGIAGRKEKSTRTTTDLFPTSSFLPYNFTFLGGTAGGPNDPENDVNFAAAIKEFVRQAAEGLPPEVLQRQLATIMAGVGRAQEASGRQAALGFGPQSLTQAQANMAGARQSADVQANFAMANQQIQSQNTAALLDFFRAIQGIRTGVPSSIKNAQPGPGFASGALQGAGQGAQIFSAVGGMGGGAV
jgi:hypothetical protein